MTVMAIVLGLGIMVLAFFYMAISLDEVHMPYKVISFFFGIFTLYILGSFLLNNQMDCSIVLRNETVAGNLTTYAYERECYPLPTSTGDITFRLLNWFMRISTAYVFLAITIYFFMEYHDKIQSIIRYVQRRFR